MFFYTAQYPIFFKIQDIVRIFRFFLAHFSTPNPGHCENESLSTTNQPKFCAGY